MMFMIPITALLGGIAMMMGLHFEAAIIFCGTAFSIFATFFEWK